MPKTGPAALAGLCALLSGSTALAQPPAYPNVPGPGGAYVAPQPVADTGIDTVTGKPCVLSSSATCALTAADANNAPFLGERPLTVGTPDAVGPGRGLKANCSATGNVAVTYQDGSVGVWMVSSAGTHIFGAAVVQVNTAGTTATCAYANLK